MSPVCVVKLHCPVGVRHRYSLACGRPPVRWLGLLRGYVWNEILFWCRAGILEKSRSWRCLSRTRKILLCSAEVVKDVKRGACKGNRAAYTALSVIRKYVYRAYCRLTHCVVLYTCYHFDGYFLAYRRKDLEVSCGPLFVRTTDRIWKRAPECSLKILVTLFAVFAAKTVSDSLEQQFVITTTNLFPVFLLSKRLSMSMRAKSLGSVGANSRIFFSLFLFDRGFHESNEHLAPII